MTDLTLSEFEMSEDAQALGKALRREYMHMLGPDEDTAGRRWKKALRSFFNFRCLVLGSRNFSKVLTKGKC